MKCFFLNYNQNFVTFDKLTKTTNGMHIKLKDVDLEKLNIMFYPICSANLDVCCLIESIPVQLWGYMSKTNIGKSFNKSNYCFTAGLHVLSWSLSIPSNNRVQNILMLMAAGSLIILPAKLPTK